MGNEANCQRFCDHKPQDNNDVSSQIKMNEYPLQCEICQNQVEHTEFKNHLDLNHFASIEQRNESIWVICVLCNKNSNNLTEHKSHLFEKHSSLAEHTKTGETARSQTSKHPDKPKLCVRQIKSKLKEIDSVGRVKVVVQTEPSQWTVEYQSQLYQMSKHSKEYNGMDYDDNQVYSQLVLTPILINQLQEATYYIMQRTPLDKTILCACYILVRAKNSSR